MIANLRTRYGALHNSMPNLTNIGMRMSTQAAVHDRSAPDYAPPMFIQSMNGSRCLEMRRPMHGNILDTETTAMITSKVNMLATNNVVQCLLFSSEDPDMFSISTIAKNNNSHEIESLHEMSKTINNSKKVTVCMYGGAMTSTAYSAFAGCDYKLGSNVVEFKMTELSQGTLPAAGTAYYFAHSKATGIEMARYLAVTGRLVRADEMYLMGLLTHLVEENAQSSLTHAIAHTIPSKEDLEDSKNPDAVSREQSIQGLLDIMHIGDEGNMDITNHEIWNDFVLVPPGRWDTLDEEETIDPNEVEDLETIHEQVAACFGGNLESTYKLLEAVDKPWSRDALQRMQVLDKTLVEQWWDLTAFAKAKKGLNDVLAKELELLRK